MSHVGFRPVEESLEFQTVGVSVCYHVTDLPCKKLKTERKRKDRRKKVKLNSPTMVAKMNTPIK